MPINQDPATNKAKRNTVALKAFFGICQKWEFSSKQESKLLGIPLSTLYKWKNNHNGSLSADTLERISYILGIYKALRILLPSEAAANKWVHKSNNAPLFNGKTALEKLEKGLVIDLADVRRYLDVECG